MHSETACRGPTEGELVPGADARVDGVIRGGAPSGPALASPPRSEPVLLARLSRTEGSSTVRCKGVIDDAVVGAAAAAADWADDDDDHIDIRGAASKLLL